MTQNGENAVINDRMINDKIDWMVRNPISGALIVWVVAFVLAGSMVIIAKIVTQNGRGGPIGAMIDISNDGYLARMDGNKRFVV